jgi:hypothetical protein
MRVAFIFLLWCLSGLALAAPALTTADLDAFASQFLADKRRINDYIDIIDDRGGPWRALRSALWMTP